MSRLNRGASITLILLSAGIALVAAIGVHRLRREPDPVGGAVGAVDSGAAAPTVAEATDEVDVPQVLAVPSPLSPRVLIGLVFRTGSSEDGMGYEGLTHLTARWMAEGGAGALYPASISRKLESIDSTMGVQVDKEVTIFYGSSPREHSEELGNLLVDIVLRPRLEPEEFARIRDQSLATIKDDLRSGRDRRAEESAVYNVIARNHPYSHPAEGRSAALQSITMEHARRHMRHKFVGDRLLVSLGGSFPPGLGERLARRLAGLPQGERPFLPPGPFRLTRDHKLLAFSTAQAEAEDSSPARISLALPLAVDVSSDDIVPLMLFRAHVAGVGAWTGSLDRMLSAAGVDSHDLGAGPASKEPSLLFQVPHLGGLYRSRQHLTVQLPPVAQGEEALAVAVSSAHLQRLGSEGLTREAFQEVRGGLLKAMEEVADEPSSLLAAELACHLQRSEGCLRRIRERLEDLHLEAANRVIAERIGSRGWVISVSTVDPSPLVEELVGGVKVGVGEAAGESLPFRIPKERTAILEAETLFP